MQDTKTIVNIREGQSLNSLPTEQPNEAWASPVRQEVLLRVLKKVPRVDFREELGLEEDEKPKQKHIVVSIIDKVLSLAMKINLGLAVQNDFIYIFNGKHWAVVDKNEFKAFLAEAAQAMGYNLLECRHYAFRHELFNQFLAVSYFPPPEAEEGVTLINLHNGTLEVTPQGFFLREHRAEDFLTYCLPFDYNQKASCPKFDTYLKQVQPDEPARHLLAEYIGAIFTTKKVFRYEKVLLLYGTGANGKSVFFDILNSMLGRENISNYSLKHLNEEHNRAMIVNKLLNYGSEIGGNIDTELWKTLASGEPMQARLKYGNSFISENYARLAFNCNVLPSEVEHTHGFFRRFLIVPFDVTIPEAQRNLNLANEIIEDELPGVLNWVLKGLDRILRNKNFTRYSKVEEVVKQYQLESDSVAMFLEEAGYKPSIEENAALKYVFQEYRSYCIDNGFKAVASKNFRKRLETQGFTSSRRSSGWVILCSKLL